jgi:hypothetical protein
MAMVFAAEGLDGGEKLLLLAYTNYTDPHGYCWPSEQRLADDCGTSLSTVARQKRSLKAKKLLKSVRRINPKTGEPISNLSRVNLPLLASMSRPNRSYDDNVMQQISFDEDTPEDSDLLKCHSDGYPLSDRQVPTVKMTGTPGQSDSQSLSDPPREPVEIPKDGRSPSASGSRSSRAGGSAASGKTKPPSLTHGQRQQVDALFAALPKPLADLVPDNPPSNLKAAVLEALAADKPEARTPQQLVDYRLMPKWDKHYARQDQVGPLERPVGVLITMLKRTKECQDPRCDERTNVDNGRPCISCEQRGVDRRAERAAERPVEALKKPAPAPAPRPATRRAPASVPPPREAAMTEVSDQQRALARQALMSRARVPK